MRTRLSKILAALAVLTALVAGGAALASGATSRQHQAPAPAATIGDPADTGNAEQPDQADPAETDTAQQGDQSSTDAAEPQAGESSNDGPGGYADASPNADMQQQGEH